MTTMTLPERVSDAIHRLIWCVPAEMQHTALGAAAKAAETETERYRGFLTASGHAPAYQHLRPMADALANLRGSFDTLSLAQSYRGTEAIRNTTSVLAAAATTPGQRMQAVLSEVSSQLHFHSEAMVGRPYSSEAIRLWVEMERRLELMENLQADTPQQLETQLADVLGSVRDALRAAALDRSLPERLAQKWRVEFEETIDDVLAHYAFARSQAAAPAPVAEQAQPRIDAATRELRRADTVIAVLSAHLSDEARARARTDLANRGLGDHAATRGPLLAGAVVTTTAPDAHTSGPWIAVDAVVGTADGQIRIADCVRLMGEVPAEANARRIAACANALQDVPTDVLEQVQSVDDLIEALQQGQGMKP